MEPGSSGISLAQAQTGKSYNWCYRTLAREQEKREMEELKLYTLREVEKDTEGNTENPVHLYP